MPNSDPSPPHILPDSVAEIVKTRPIRLGTRQSPLALAQARMASASLCAAYGLSEDQVEMVTMVATGDRVQDRALREVGGKALWTKELDRALLDGSIDAAVHSLKDVETIRDPAFTISAMLPRADARDVLLGADSLADIPRNAVLGTSSPRRAAQMQHFRPDISVTLFRGNVATRLKRLADGEADITLLAAAGIDRLALNLTGHRLALDHWLPAPSQGAIGIEVLTANTALRALFMAIDDNPTSNCVTAERALLLALNGDCHSPISAHARYDGDTISLSAELYSEDGKDKVAGDVMFDAGDKSAAIGLAHELLARAPTSITKLFSGQ